MKIYSLLLIAALLVLAAALYSLIQPVRLTIGNDIFYPGFWEFVPFVMLFGACWLFYRKEDKGFLLPIPTGIQVVTMLLLYPFTWWYQHAYTDGRSVLLHQPATSRYPATERELYILPYSLLLYFLLLNFGLK